MTTPLSAAEFALLMAPLGPFEARPCLAVAVSGGADSLALALLAHEWARGLGGEAVALTVDHGLRAESAAEAARVGAWAAARGLAHRTLVWDGPKPAADLQAEARAARYRLLDGWCRDHAVLHLLLAHHQDDQAETLLLRLGRGSGVDGLAAMPPVQEGFSVRCLRPLLRVPRARLAATLAATGQDWIEDPSNANAAFARVRLRRLMPALAAEGMGAERLADTARRLGRARAALEAATARLAARWVRPHPAGYVLVDPRAFAEAEDEVALRLLVRLLTSVGGGAYAPREERSERLLARLRDGLGKPATLAGCRIGPLAGRLLICREAAKVAPPVALVPGTEMVWDGRFRVRVAEDAPSGLRLGVLGPTGWNRLAAELGPRLPPVPGPARPTLPAIYGEEAISAVPHVGYNRTSAAERALRWIVAAPPNPLTVAGRCLV